MTDYWAGQFVLGCLLSVRQGPTGRLALVLDECWYFMRLRGYHGIYRSA